MVSEVMGIPGVLLALLCAGCPGRITSFELLLLDVAPAKQHDPVSSYTHHGA